MRILIVRLSALGDIITSMAVLQFIHQSYPQAKIDWLVDKRFQEVLKNHPHLNQVHSISLKKYKGHFFKLIREMVQKSKEMPFYDLIIDMQGLMKSAVLSRLIGKNVVGFDRKSVKESLSAFFYQKKANISFNEHILKRNFALLQDPLQIHVSYEEAMKKSSYLYFDPPIAPLNNLLHSEKKNLLIVLGGSWASKTYPKEQLVQVLNQLDQYHLLILWSNEEEMNRAKWLHERCPRATFLPKLSLNDLMALISKVDGVLGNDTGPTHMAWALNKPSVTILGCTSKTRIPENEWNLCVTSKTEVNPSKINKKDLSIQDIEPKEIVEKVCYLMNKV